MLWIDFDTKNALKYYFGVQSSLELQHVLILLGINVLVRKVHQQTIHAKPAQIFLYYLV